MVKATLLIPFHNAATVLPACIESILAQTLTDFQVVFINDGSTDQSVQVIQSYQQDNFILLHNIGKMGVAHSLNRGLDYILETDSPYILRMDADDIMHADRVRAQLAFMEAHPTIAVTSSNMLPFRGNIHIQQLAQYGFLSPIHVKCVADTPEILEKQKTGNFLNHPTIGMRTDRIRTQAFRYNTRYQVAEDYDLWCRMLLAGEQFAFLGNPLVAYRLKETVDPTTRRRQEAETRDIQKQFIKELEKLSKKGK